MLLTLTFSYLMQWYSYIKCDLSVQICCGVSRTGCGREAQDVVYVICFHKHVPLYCPVVWPICCGTMMPLSDTEVRLTSTRSHAQSKHLPVHMYLFYYLSGLICLLLSGLFGICANGILHLNVCHSQILQEF